MVTLATFVGLLCTVFFLNASSYLMLVMMYTHIGYICVAFLQCAFSSVFS